MGFKPTHKQKTNKPTHCAGWGSLTLFLFSFFSITQPSSAGRGPFASLAGGPPSPLAFVILAYAGVFEDRAVAMGKAHCNCSICTFGFAGDQLVF